MIGIYGGAFDPVHIGHLALASTALQHLPLKQIYFVPLGQAVHRRPPQATAKQRQAMLQAAIQDQPKFVVDTTEVHKSSPSWTIDTVVEFKCRFPNQRLCLLMGSDTFCTLDQWRDWSRLLDYTHICVMTRPSRSDWQNDLSPTLRQYSKVHQSPVNNRLDDRCSGQGSIAWLDLKLPDVSSTQIRQLVQAGIDLHGLTPDAVIQLIDHQQLYDAKH